jgi:hypothetical protein
VCKCVVFVIILLCKYLCKKKNLLCTLHSNAPFAFERRHEAAFELTCVCSTTAPHLTDTPLYTCVRPYPIGSNADMGLHLNSRASISMQRPLHTHTLSTYAIERTNYIRSHAFLALSRSLFLSLLPISPPHRTAISHLPHPSSSNLPIIQTLPPPIISPTTIAPLRHLCTATTHRQPSISPFLSFLTENPISPKTLFSSIFFVILGHNSTHGLCPLFVL